MLFHARRFALLVGSGLGCLALAAPAAASPFQASNDYNELTNPRVEVTNFNPEPFTGMVFDSDNRLWAVNPYGNTIVRYDTIVTTNSGTVFPTGLNPVSIGRWTPPLGPPPHPITPGGTETILVACNGTHGLFMHKASNGRILDFLRLDSEPADLVVDPDNHRAFISCQGDNTVVEVNLITFQRTRSYKLPCGSRAGPLYLDRGVTGPGDNRVYVAPALTGNNSIPIHREPSGFDPTTGQPLDWDAAGFIEDLDDNTLNVDTDPWPDNQLPDLDVFRLNPETRTIEAVIRKAGTLIFDIDRNPFNQQLWVLSTDSLNKFAADTEPALRGVFAVNQLVRVAGVTNTSALITGGLVQDLDDTDPGTSGSQYVPARSANQVRTVEFLKTIAVGFGFAASAQADVIVGLNRQGGRTGELTLPGGAQCYDLALLPNNENILAALCLGTMTIEVFDWTQPALGSLHLPLGFDPTPDQIKKGRDVFLDGQRSKDGRLSCASCHPRAMSDILCWPLRGHPTDEKDIMLTQSLLSIADTFPHHWRGERDLEDFKKAFDGLLGAPASEMPTNDEMKDLIAYFQSLQAPANPVQDFRRILNDANGTTVLPSPPVPDGMEEGSSAIAGQIAFTDPESFNQKSCAECHAPQSGSDGSLMSEGFIFNRSPRSSPIEMAHLRQLLLRTPEFVNIDPADGSTTAPFNQNGFGTLHDGREASLLHFIILSFPPISEQQRLDAFRFTEQFDQGIAPAVHWGQRFWQSSPAGTETEIEAILINGTKTVASERAKPWNDVVAIGRFDPDGTGPSPMSAVRWWLDTSLDPDAFVPDKPGFTNTPWSTMITETRAGRGDLVFLGVPHRNGRRFGIDHDGDGLINGVELGGTSSTLPWDPDTDHDGWPDKYEVDNGDNPLVSNPNSSSDITPPTLLTPHELDFTNSRIAKYHVRFSEDVKYTVTYSTSGGQVRTFSRDYFTSADTFVLTHEDSSAATLNSFDVTISFRDRKADKLGGPTVGTASLTPFVADVIHFPDFPTGKNCHVKKPVLTRINPSPPGTLTATVRIKVDYNFNAPVFNGFPATDLMVFCSLAVKHAGEGQPFIKLDETTTGLGFDTDHPTAFDIDRDGAGTAPLIDYNVAPGKDWICSPHTGSIGLLGPEETEIAFSVHGLVPGDVVKVSVMGVVTPMTPGSAAGGYNMETLRELQPFLLEDTMDVEETF